MSQSKRLKKAAAVLLALILLSGFSGSSFAAEIVPDEEIEDSRYEYRTEEILYGDIEVPHEFNFTEYVWKTKEIRWHGEDRICGECRVKYRKEIKAGDPVMTLVYDIPEIDIEERERALQRKKEAFEQTKLDYEEARNVQIRQMNETQDTASRELLSLQIQRKDVEYEKKCFDEERAIAEEEEIIRLLRTETVITSPVSGMVSFVTDAKDGKTVIHDGDVIARIRYADRLVVAISQKDDNQPARMHYGNEARFLMMTEGQVTGSVSGTVIASNCIPEMSNEKSNEGWSFVVLDEQDPEKIAEILGREKPINTFGKMYYVERDLNHVLCVPASAVRNGKNGSYVLVLRDGDRINKRYVTLGDFHSDDWYELISGLREGERVVTKERSF